MAVVLGGITLPFACCRVNAPLSSIKDIAFPGLDGLGGLDMGLRNRPITITGFLPDAVDGVTKAKDIEGLDTSATMTLDTGIGGRTFAYCLVLSAVVEPLKKVAGPTGEKFVAEYTIELVQRRYS